MNAAEHSHPAVLLSSCYGCRYLVNLPPTVRYLKDLIYNSVQAPTHFLALAQCNNPGMLSIKNIASAWVIKQLCWNTLEN
jgi:hypothetical protein